MITVKIAGLPIGIIHKHERIKIITKNYLTDEEPLFVVSATPEHIEVEKKRVNDPQYGEDYYESLIIYRNIAEKLPEYDAFLFHGAAISYRGKAYIITANSGVGKTTHIRLWHSSFGDEVGIINGDKPIFRIIDGVAYAFGTPWQGKENYGRNVSAPIGGIAFLSRAAENKAYPISASEAVMFFMSQIYLPLEGREALSKTLMLADKLFSSVKLVKLECNMDPEAATVCRDALLGEKDG